jgi:hypothetical protein
MEFMPERTKIKGDGKRGHIMKEKTKKRIRERKT